MSKKNKKHKFKKHSFRNAAVAPRAPRAPRLGQPQDETALKRLGYTAAGAAGSAFIGAFLSKEGWAPKTVAGALTALGGGLTWKGDGPTIKSVGSGAMSSAGGQLILMLMEERNRPAPQVAKKPANAGELPPGSLENALERARARLALSAEGMEMAA